MYNISTEPIDTQTINSVHAHETIGVTPHVTPLVITYYNDIHGLYIKLMIFIAHSYPINEVSLTCDYCVLRRNQRPRPFPDTPLFRTGALGTYRVPI